MHVHEEGGANTGRGSANISTRRAWAERAGRGAGRRSVTTASRKPDGRSPSWSVRRESRGASSSRSRRAGRSGRRSAGDLVCFQSGQRASRPHRLSSCSLYPTGRSRPSRATRARCPAPDTRRAKATASSSRFARAAFAQCSSRIPGNVADPKPKAGFDDWAKWVKGGKKGKRPDVPEQVPHAWWAKLADGIDAKHDAHPPAHVKAPAHAGVGH